MGDGVCCRDSMDGASELLQGDSVVVEPERSGAGALLHVFLGEGMGNEEQISGRGASRGSLAWMMDATIFSRWSEVMWRSRPRLRLLAHESCLRILGRRISMGADSEVKSTASSSATESTLPDS
jgi:hypothetical protein